MKKELFSSPLFKRIFPFCIFMAFIALEELLRKFQDHEILHIHQKTFYFFYVVKVVLVVFFLLSFRKSYIEVKFKELFIYRKTVLSLLSGLIIFIMWIKFDWTLNSNHIPSGFNPEVFEDNAVKSFMIFTKLTSAVFIVPIMEELFWRSFMIRYLINSNFMAVEIGRYSFFSFVAVSLLFGLEHHYIVAGILAGAILNGVYYVTKSISQCILSHATANFCLSIYVLHTSNWHFW